MGLGQLGAGIHDGVIDVGLGQGSGAVHGGAASHQLGRSIGLHLQRQRVTGTVQTVGHQMTGHALGVKAVDQLVDGLILVDIHGQKAGVTMGHGGAGLLVVVGYGHFGVADGHLDSAGLGATLVTIVADDAHPLDKGRTQLGIDQFRITFSCNMRHSIVLSVRS